MIILFLIILLLMAIPRIDPLKKNIEKFRNYYNGLIVIFTLFMFWIHILIILWSVDTKIPITYAIIPAITLLFFYIGILLPKTKRNWFVGIRTPWTLSSDRVWDTTHKKGGLVFKILAVIMLISLFYPDYMLWIIIIPILLAVAYLFAYSYLEYQKEAKK